MDINATVLKQSVEHIGFHFHLSLAVKDTEAYQMVDIDVAVVTFEDIRLD